jgi:Flp pilus assembly pilin Flp
MANRRPAGGLARALSLTRRKRPFSYHHKYFQGEFMEFVRRLWSEQEGQDIAEYAVMLAVILVIVVGTIRLIGSNANNVFSNVASSIQ